MPDPVTRVTQTQSDILGCCSGNKGDNNTYDSYNNKFELVLPSTTDFVVRNQGAVSGAGEAGIIRIPERNSRFTGRQSLLEEVKRFSERGGHSRVALHGLGGSGKTQIALEYVHQRAGESNCNIFWVQGSGVSKFSEGFRAIAQHVGILVSTETAEAGLLSVKRWLEGRKSGNWILVIDNADNEADFVAKNSPIAKFIPQGTSGTLIFTTRSRQVASSQSWRMIEVRKMEEEEALELFSEHFGCWGSLEDKEKEDVASILRSVHHLPLGVVGSAAYMAGTATLPSMYWNIFRENEERMKDLLLQPFYDIQREAAHESILSTHFATFDQIRKQMPLAADLLRLMAFFNHQKIPEELLAQCGLEGVDHSANFRCAIGKLSGFSLVTIDKFGDKIFYHLHRLVQLALQAYLPPRELNQGRAAAVKAISRLFPPTLDKGRCFDHAFIPHALAVTKDPTDPIAEELGVRVALYLLNMGSYADAETQFHQCTALREERKE